MKRHQPVRAAGPRLSPRADSAVRWIAPILTLVGALLLFSGLAGGGIAFPLVAIGAALVAIEQADRRRGGTGARRRTTPL